MEKQDKSFTLEVKDEIQAINFDDESKEFLKNVFLTGGSIADPHKEYHLEILTDNIEMAQCIVDILKTFGIEAKFIEKKYKFVVYIKSSEMIALFLNVLTCVLMLFSVSGENVLMFFRFLAKFSCA